MIYLPLPQAFAKTVSSVRLSRANSLNPLSKQDVVWSLWFLYSKDKTNDNYFAFPWTWDRHYGRPSVSFRYQIVIDAVAGYFIDKSSTRGVWSQIEGTVNSLWAKGIEMIDWSRKVFIFCFLFLPFESGAGNLKLVPFWIEHLLQVGSCTRPGANLASSVRGSFDCLRGESANRCLLHRESKHKNIKKMMRFQNGRTEGRDEGLKLCGTVRNCWASLTFPPTTVKTRMRSSFVRNSQMQSCCVEASIRIASSTNTRPPHSTNYRTLIVTTNFDFVFCFVSS